jgi:WD40 repeat protein/predicted Ser/Thr protein kinase
MLELGFESGVSGVDATGPLAESGDDGPGEIAKPLTSIGRYRILRLIGQGGMGTVYEAEQAHPQRIVALKIISPGMATPELLRRFDQESHALGRLQHPGIAQIYEAGTAETGFGPQPYFAMEFIQGKPLTDYAREHRLNARQRLDIMARVAEAAHHAHQRGLIHRDLKPANILVDATGQPKILDFGVARATDSDAQATQATDLGRLVGTLAYMSPEQLLADPLELDTRSDVYALGVILYELLAGRLPYDIGKRLDEAVQAIREEDPSRLSAVDRTYRGDIETIVAKTLEKDRTRRYESAAELAADIRRYLQDEPIAARPPSASYQLRKFARRHKAVVASAAAVLIAVAAGLATTMKEARRANAGLDRAVIAERAALNAAEEAAAERDGAIRANAEATQAANRAIKANAEATQAANRAVDERKRADKEAATAMNQRFQALVQSLAFESLRQSASRLDDDLAALLARQAMLIDEQRQSRFRSTVEDALQQVVRTAPWSHDILRNQNIDIYSVAVSPTGDRIAAVGTGGSVRVWDWRDLAAPPLVLQAPIKNDVSSGFFERVAALGFSPDGNRLFAAVPSAGPFTVGVWDLRKAAAPPVLLRGHKTRVRSGTFLADGFRLAIGGSDGTVCVLDLRDTSAAPAILAGHRFDVGGLASSGTRLASGGVDGTVRVWDQRNLAATPLVLVFGDQRTGVDTVALSRDGLRVAAVDVLGEIRTWDLRNPEAPPLVLQGHKSNVITIAFSPDGNQLASASGDRTVRIWDLRNPNVSPMVLTGHQSTVMSVAFSPDGSRLLTGGLDKTLRVWDLRPAAFPVALEGLPGSTSQLVNPVAFSPKGELAFVVGDTVRVLDASNPHNQPLVFKGESYKFALGSALGSTKPGKPTSVAFAPDGLRLASGWSDGVRVWDLRKPAAPPIVFEGCLVLSVAFSPNGQRLAAGTECDDVALLVWDVAEPKTPIIQDKRLMGTKISSVAFSPDGLRLAAGAYEGPSRGKFVRVYDLEKPSASPLLLYQNASAYGGTSVAFSPNGERASSVEVDGVVRVWDLRNPGTPPVVPAGSLVSVDTTESFEAGRRLAYPLAFSPDGRYLATGGASLRIWDLQNLGIPPAVIPVSGSVAFSPDGTLLASGASDGSVRIWPLWRTAADYLCTRVRRNLSMDEWRLHIGPDIPYERTCPQLPPGAGVIQPAH